MNRKEKQIKDNAILQAEAQLTGYYQRQARDNIGDLLSSMGLTKPEWKQIKKRGYFDYLSKSDKQEIEDYYKK